MAKGIKAFLLFILVCGGCFTRTVLMTRESFDEIHLGTPVSEVITIAGRPYKIHSMSGRKQEYEYVERLNLGKSLVTENHYYLVIMEGRVISKRFSQEHPPAFDIIYHDNPTLTY